MDWSGAENSATYARLMTGNDAITDNYLLHLQDKYAKTIAIEPNDIPKLEGLPIPKESKGWTTTTPIAEQDKNDGILGTPLPEQDKQAGLLLGSEINIGDWRDNVITAQQYDPNIKTATGVTVGEFDKSLIGISPNERVAKIKETAKIVAKSKGMTKDNKLSVKNNRDVYKGTDGNYIL